MALQSTVRAAKRKGMSQGARAAGGIWMSCFPPQRRAGDRSELAPAAVAACSVPACPGPLNYMKGGHITSEGVNE